MRDRREQPCGLVKNLLAHTITEIDRQIEQMILFRSELESYQREWSDRADLQSERKSLCPLIASVSLPND